MWFLSIYTLKSIISIGIVVTLLIGIILLYVLVYAFIISSVTAQVQETFRNIFIASFLTSSVLMILSSLGGIYGLIRKLNKFLIIYSITMFIYFVVFLLLAIFIIQYPYILQSDCEDSVSNQFQTAVTAANQTLCKTCQCNFHRIIDYTFQQQRILKNMGFINYPPTQNDTLPQNAQSCSGWSNSTYFATEQLIMIQSYFSCSGWCSVDPQYNLYYLFTDVNNGKPLTTCVASLLKFFNKFGLVIEISSFLVSGIILIILIFIICLCCHPLRDRKYDGLKMFATPLLPYPDIQDTTKQPSQVLQ